MKFTNVHSIPNQLISEPSQTEFKYMDDHEDYPSQENLQMYMSPSDLQRNINQQMRFKGSAKNENNQGKISKKKSVVKEHKGNSSHNSLPIKRTQSSHIKNSNLNNTKQFSKKSSQFIKYSEFELIQKAFNMFSSQFITFNQLVLALKSIGVEIQSEKKFQSFKIIFDEIIGKNEVGIDFEAFGMIANKFLKEEKAKFGSDLCHIEKGFYYMVQEANKIRWPFDDQDQSQQSPKELFNEFKLYVDRLPNEKKYLTKDSLTYLKKYLGMETQLTQKDVENIMKYGDKQEKGYLSFEDVIRCIQGNKIIEV